MYALHWQRALRFTKSTLGLTECRCFSFAHIPCYPFGRSDFKSHKSRYGSSQYCECEFRLVQEFHFPALDGESPLSRPSSTEINFAFKYYVSTKCGVLANEIQSSQSGERVYYSFPGGNVL